jgi:hypothetical protein
LRPDLGRAIPSYLLVKFWELLTVRYSRDFRAQTAREIIDLADNPTVRDEG